MPSLAAEARKTASRRPVRAACRLRAVGAHAFAKLGADGIRTGREHLVEHPRVQRAGRDGVDVDARAALTSERQRLGEPHEAAFDAA